jgi:AAA+ superfamily predicted ATPase
MAARHLANSLELPLYVVDLAGLISSFLGKTGQNLRQVLDFGRSQSSVLLLDEFDAVAKRRDDDSDIGELKRIVNVLLLELERWPDHTVLVAATNHAELLDRAIRRRFDFAVDLEPPGPDTRRLILKRSLAGDWSSLKPPMIKAAVLATEGWTGSDLVQFSLRVRRLALLTDDSISAVVGRELLNELQSRQLPNGREAYAALALDAGMTQREVAGILGVSHPTTGKMARRFRRMAEVGDG